MQTILKQNHEDYFLQQGWYFALGFQEGWFVGRVVHSTWSDLQPWSLGAVGANGTLVAYDEVQDPLNRHYLEPYKPEMIYHTFWGITPTAARAKLQYPTRSDLGSMLAIPRTLTDNVGFIDGEKSPFFGQKSQTTEIFTVKDQYSAFQVYNPLWTAMANVKINFEQRQYTYALVKDKALIKDLLIGNRRVRKYTMGSMPLPMNIPAWLQELIRNSGTPDLLRYTQNVMAGEA